MSWRPPCSLPSLARAWCGSLAKWATTISINYCTNGTISTDCRTGNKPIHLGTTTRMPNRRHLYDTVPGDDSPEKAGCLCRAHHLRAGPGQQREDRFSLQGRGPGRGVASATSTCSANSSHHQLPQPPACGTTTSTGVQLNVTSTAMSMSLLAGPVRRVHEPAR